MADQEELDFKEGDRLAMAGDQTAIEYGWWGSEFIHREAQRSDADPESRAAFTWALTILEKRHGRYLSRSQLTDRIRIGMAFPRDTYRDLVTEIHYTPTFSQLRAAYVRDDPKTTMDLILWAAENDASPADIQARKMGGVPESEECRAWRNLVMWADKYIWRSGGVNPEREKLARAVVQHDMTKK